MNNPGFNPSEAWSAPNKGWECPKCGKCWAPTVPGCMRCNNQAGQGTVKPKENTDDN